MALWPFTRRRSSRKRPRSGGGAALPDPNLDRPGPGPEATPPPPMAETAAAAERQKKRRTMHEPQAGASIENNSSMGANTIPSTRLRRRTRATTSFSAGPHDSIHIPTAVSGRRGGGGGGSRSGSAAAAGALQPTGGATDAGAMRAAMLDQDMRQAPTLRSQRGSATSASPGGPAATTTNRKSSRLGRGAELKALSTSHLSRPATEGASAAAVLSGSWIWSGQPANRDSRRSRSAGFALAAGGRETSDISLPSAESIHSSLSSDFEYAFRVSTLDSLAPRPTLRYNSSSRLAPGAEDEAGGPSRRPSQRNRYMSEPIPAALLDARRRIDDLADDLDASSLRILMERDQRRRARKEQQDRERAERRLARRATAQLQEEERARATGTPLPTSPPDTESRVLDREVDRARTPSPPPPQQQRTPARDPILVPLLRRSGSDMLMVELPDDVDDADSEDNTRHDSGDDRDVVMTDAPGPDPEPSRPETTQAQPRAESSLEEAPRHTPELHAAGGNSQMPTPPHSPAPPNSNDLKRKKSVSRSSLASEQGKFTVVKLPRPEEDDRDRPSASTPCPRPAKKKSKRLSISTFFKWRGRSKGPAEGQSSSSFSNTSREEGLAAAAAASGSGGPSIRNTLSPIRRVGSNVPKRTRSRFREDLPELPISPPSSSRIHSPESDAPMSQLVAGQPESNASMVRRDDNDDDNDDDNGNDARTSDQRGTPVSWPPRTHSPEPLAVSLGSIDSEGSWFGGGGGGAGKARVISRTVSRATRHQSPSRRRRRSRGSFDSSGSGLDYADDAAIVEDDYMARLTPRTQQHTLVNRESVGEGRPSSDEDGELVLEPGDRDAKWGSIEARQYATMVHSPPLKTVRSREGLLNSYPVKEEPQQAGEEGEDERQAEPDEDSSRRGTRNSSVSSAGCGVLARATSVSLGKGRVRRISLTNMKLVDLTPPPTSAEESPTQGRRKSTGTILG